MAGELFRSDRHQPEPLPQPDLHKLAQTVRSPRGGFRTLAITGLFVLACFYTLYFCRSLLLPLVLAALLALLLLPAVRALKRLRIPEPLGAGMVVLALLAVVGVGIYELSAPAIAWIERAPQSLRTAEVKLREVRRSMLRLGQATEQVARIAEEAAPPVRRPAVAVEVQPASTLRDRLLSGGFGLAADAVVMIILLYFLLASGDLFLRKLVRVLPRPEDKRRAVEIARQIEDDVSAYLGTVTLIHLALGAAVALVFSLLGVPNPLLWGAMVAVLNFIPYLGTTIDYVVFALVGVLTFSTLPRMLAPVGAFLVLNVLEAYLITPILLSRRLTLNPVVVFVGLTFWTWMWGIVGAILAVPITVVCKILCDHVEPLAPIGEFLGQ